MTISIALFTRDLRVHDNPVLRAAGEDDRVVPLFVVDDGTAAFRSPNKRAALEEDGRELVVHEAVVTAVAPGEVTPGGKDHFAVFTPYHRKWAEVSRRKPLGPPRSVRMPRVAAGELPGPGELGGEGGAPAPELLPGGERPGRERMHAWRRRIADYADGQDLLARDDTSRLSPYLHFGCVSPTELAHTVGTGSDAAAQFVRQLAWRDFHHQVLAARPAAARRDYRDRSDRWRRDRKAFDAWREGRTGVPVGMPGCGSCWPRAGCTTGPGCWSAAS